MFSWNSKSICRDYLEKILNKLPKAGEVLDVGGGKAYGYENLLKAKSIYSINIDPKSNCSKIGDIERKFPFKDNNFDTVLCLNVLEHVYKYEHVLSESTRVLKKGGSLIIFVPFMHHLHANPYDFNRFSDKKLEKMLTEQGYKNINIKPLIYGICSLVFQTTINWWVLPVRPLVKNIAVGLDWVGNRLGFYKRVSESIPLAYFVKANK